MTTATHARTRTSTRQKEEGSIATVFSSLSGGTPALPPRFPDIMGGTPLCKTGGTCFMSYSEWLSKSPREAPMCSRSHSCPST